MAICLRRACFHIEFGNVGEVWNVSCDGGHVNARANLAGGGTVVRDRSGRATDGKGGFFLNCYVLSIVTFLVCGSDMPWPRLSCDSFVTGVFIKDFDLQCPSISETVESWFTGAYHMTAQVVMVGGSRQHINAS